MTDSLTFRNNKIHQHLSPILACNSKLIFQTSDSFPLITSHFCVLCGILCTFTFMLSSIDEAGIHTWQTTNILFIKKDPNLSPMPGWKWCRLWDLSCNKYKTCIYLGLFSLGKGFHLFKINWLDLYTRCYMNNQGR